MALGIHILRIYIDCVDFADVWQTFYNVNSLSNLFTNVAAATILEFLKEINLYTLMKFNLQTCLVPINDYINSYGISYDKLFWEF